MPNVLELIPTEVIEQQRQEQNHQDLEMYRRLGVLEVHTFQGDDDEEVELQMMKAMGASTEETLYCIEAGAALKEIREGK